VDGSIGVERKLVDAVLRSRIRTFDARIAG